MLVLLDEATVASISTLHVTDTLLTTK